MPITHQASGPCWSKSRSIIFGCTSPGFSHPRHLFADTRWTPLGLQAAVKKEYDIISEIVDLALAKSVTINQPFQGQNIGPFHVLSPNRAVYLHLLPQFEKTPDPNQAAIEAASTWLGKASLIGRLVEAARAKVENWTTETWAQERLRDGGQTSASNESSVVLYGAFENEQRVLLTGDAGVNALTWSADYAVRVGLPLQQFTFVQIPHHGSRRNVGPTVLTRLLGPVEPEYAEPRFSAYVSAPADDTNHPRKIVLNAFKRRGGIIIATQGSTQSPSRRFSIAARLLQRGRAAILHESRGLLMITAGNSKSLKDQNRWHLWLLIAVNSAAFYAALNFSDFESSGFRAFINSATQLLPVGLATVVTTIANGLLSADMKARLVFLRWYHALPGHRAFSKYAMA
jgi:hypothetical protein